MMNAIILCGGLSTRLGDITKDVPKILLEVGDRTVLDWQLEKLKTLGSTEVVLAVGHLARVLHERVGDKRHGLELIYAIEDKRLGTGGAIKHALAYVLNPNEPSVIFNGDILTTVDLKDMAARLKPESDGIILASHVIDVASYGTLEYDNDYRLTAFKEKEGKHQPGYQNGGCYIFNPSVSQYFPPPDTFSIEYDVFPKMKKLQVYQSDRPWVDIGVPERLQWARENWWVFE